MDLYGKMHCGVDYDIVCSLLPTAWRCNPYGISICNESYIAPFVSNTEYVTTTNTYIPHGTEMTDVQSVTDMSTRYLNSKRGDSESEGEQVEMWSMVLIGASIVVIICITIYVCVRQMKRDHNHGNDVISNGLVVIMVIGEYDHNVEDADFDGYLQSLPIQNDTRHLTELFRLLNYKIIPQNMDKLHWTEDEVARFLITDIGNELFDDHGELKYDGLVVCISAHGLKDNIITSDYRTIEKTVIHRIISMKYPKSREIPRIFLFDSCEGSLERQRSQFIRATTVNEDDYKLDILPMHDTGEEQKNSRDLMMEHDDEDKGISLNNIATGNAWTMSTKNPDFKLVEIHAANSGFQAKCNRRLGSYLIYSFTMKMKQNIEGKQRKTLGAVFEEIQNELHDAGKSLTKNVFNNSTGRVEFMVNSNSK
eukprot:186152_1